MKKENILEKEVEKKMIENVKPLSFERWLDLTQPHMDRHRYMRAHPALKGKLHRRYNDYLEGWEREIGRAVKEN